MERKTHFRCNITEWRGASAACSWAPHNTNVPKQKQKLYTHTHVERKKSKSEQGLSLENGTMGDLFHCYVNKQGSL